MLNFRSEINQETQFSINLILKKELEKNKYQFKKLPK